LHIFDFLHPAGTDAGKQTGRRFFSGLACALVFGLTLCGTVAAADEPLWFDGERPNKEAWQAIAILADAATEGLEAKNYNVESLRQAFAAAENGPALSAEVIALLNNNLTSAMHRFLSDLHFGQIDPRLIRENFSAPFPNGFDPASLLETLVRQQRLSEAVTSAAPTLPLYSNLRLALAHYRKLASDPVFSPLWQVQLPPVPNRKLELGQPYAGLPLLTQRLIALGDLPCDTPIPEVYSSGVVEGVMTFQIRHGLAPDGVIGRQTFEQLNVSPADRVRQIELAMERLRWTPLLHASRMIVVNVPEHTLEAYEVRDGRIEVKTRMRVIIGKALDMRTPIFDEEMRFIEFSPYWNVPLSIARSEIIPNVLRDPTYFERQGFEFVAGDGRVITTLSHESLEAARSGQMRIRQRPGPKNALGDIKFIFPNKDNIYLHHTPAPSLFQKDRRDLSHGCIRVEEPVVLAQFVLQNDPAWGEERIEQAMRSGISTTLRLREPVRVVIAYNTVVVKNDGLVYFFSDIYGQDKRLEKVLRQYLQKSPS